MWAWAAIALLAIGVVFWALDLRPFTSPAPATLRIGFQYSAPYHFPDARGNASGPVVDIIREAAQRANIHLNWVYSPQGPDKSLETNTVDLWPIVGDFPERRRVAYISNPWARMMYVLVVPGDSGLLDARDLGRRSLAIPPFPLDSVVAHQYLPDARVVTLPGLPEVMEEVCSGRAAAGLIVESPIGGVRQLECASGTLQALPLRGAAYWFGIGANKNNRYARRAADALRSQIGQMAIDGTLAGIDFRWHSSLSNEATAIFQYGVIREYLIALLAATGVAGLALVLMLVSRRRLRATRLHSTELEESYRLMFETNPLPMWVYDRENLRYLLVNEAAVSHYGYSQQEFLSMTIADIRPREDVERLRDRIASNTHGSYGAGLWRHRKKDGSLIHVEIFAHQVTIGGRRAELVLAIDVTDREYAQAERREHEALTTFVAEVNIALSRSQNLRMGLQQCTDLLVHKMPIPFARIWTMNDTGTTLELQASSGMYTHIDGAHARIPVGQFKIGRLAQEGQPRLTNNVIDDPLVTDKEWIRREGMVAFAGYPLIVDERVAGVAAVFAKQPLTQTVLDTLATLASSVAQFIKRQRAEEAVRESEDRYRDLVESSSDLIGTHDAGGKILSVNRAMLRLLQAGSPEQVVGRRLQDFLPPSVRHEFAVYLESILKLGQAQGLMRIAAPGGDRLIEYHNSVRQDEAKEPVIRCMAQDVTERWQAERAMRMAKEAAEAASRAKSEFLANISHELRTPMNGIIGMTELALEDEISPELRDCLETVKGCADSLLSILNEILDFSKMEAGKLDLHPANFRLREVLAKTCRPFSFSAGAKNLLFDWRAADEVPDELFGDPVRLGQVLTNLIGNAMKFTEHGSVTLHVSSDGPLLHFEIRDTGIGIPPEKQAMIFQAFTQADGSMTRRYGGTGLGLAICSQLVHMMHGQIWVDSQPGAGSVFHFTARLEKAGGRTLDPPLSPEVTSVLS